MRMKFIWRNRIWNVGLIGFLWQTQVENSFSNSLDNVKTKFIIESKKIVLKTIGARKTKHCFFLFFSNLIQTYFCSEKIKRKFSVEYFCATYHSSHWARNMLGDSWKKMMNTVLSIFVYFASIFGQYLDTKN